MHIGKSITVLNRRRNHLRAKPHKDDYILAEIAALTTAILCMELSFSYGFVAITETAGPLLKAQMPDANPWNNDDLNRMRKAIAKNSKIPH